MIPCGNHRLVGLGTVGIVIAALRQAFGILVVGQYKVGLMAFTLVASANNVVRKRCHGPVIGTYDTLIVIGQRYASNLSEESVFGFHFCPGFEYVERTLTRLPPNTAVLDVQPCLESRPFIANHETFTVHQELRLVVFGRRRHSSVANFAVGEHLQVNLQCVLLLDRQSKGIFFLSA